MAKPEYSAVREDDGTFTIRGVPIFGEVPKDARGEGDPPQSIGRKWLDAALAKLKQRHTEGYFPPVHFQHHTFTENDPARRAGRFRARAVKRTVYDGKPMWALFVDLEKFPERHMRMLLDHEFPYRSVEIFDYAEQVINHLALMDDTEPWFRFANLDGDTINIEAMDDPRQRDMIPFGAGVDRETAEFTTFGDFAGDPVRAVLSKTGALYCFSATGFAAKEASPMPAKVALGWDADANNWTYSVTDEDGNDVTETIEFSAPDTLPKQYMDMPEDPEEIKKLISKLQARLKKMQAADNELEEEDDKDNPGAPNASKSDAVPPEFAARFAAMEAKVQSMEDDKALDVAVEEDAATLKSAGVHVTKTMREDLRKFARDPELRKRYVETLKTHRDPVTFDSLPTATTEDPPEVMKYDKTPEMLQKARELRKLYQEASDAGLPHTVTLESYLATNMEAA